MKSLYTQKQYDESNSRNKILPVQCKQCKKTFYISKHNIQNALNPKKSDTFDFCSRKCHGDSTRKSKKVTCKTCGESFLKKLSVIKITNSNYCSVQCSYSGNKKNFQIKSALSHRSKLEIYLGEQIKNYYVNLKLVTNDREQLDGLELDFYFPEISLAIELNGIFHYQPIFGQEQFDKQIERDGCKFILCGQKNIALAIIDSSSCKKITLKAKDKYWEITKSIIDKHLAIIK